MHRPMRGIEIRCYNQNIYNSRQLLDLYYVKTETTKASIPLASFYQRFVRNSPSFSPICYRIRNDDDDNNRDKKRKLPIHRCYFKGAQYSGKVYINSVLNQNRRNSVKAADTSDTKSIAENTTDSLGSNTNDAKLNRNTDPAFASYLTGEMRPPSILDELTKLTASSVLNQRRTAAAKRSRSFALDTNNDKEIYRQIINTQNLQKEKSHRKTAINVNRALIGNVIICSGTFLYFMEYKCLLVTRFHTSKSFFFSFLRM
jgi:hypothetical protein